MASKRKSSPSVDPAQPAPPPANSQPINLSAPAPWHYLTLDQWRASAGRVQWLASLQRDSAFRELLGMLHHQATIRGSIPVDATTVAVEFGRQEGRADVLRWIAEAASSIESFDPVPVNYGLRNLNSTTRLQPATAKLGDDDEWEPV